ncbi:MAG: hypothetical protein IMW89_14220 [Ktedonobacteraceae bacterium]|nr:hypothetical protein [Ktedonobacteraceae bacterium]
MGRDTLRKSRSAWAWLLWICACLLLFSACGGGQNNQQAAQSSPTAPSRPAQPTGTSNPGLQFPQQLLTPTTIVNPSPSPDTQTATKQNSRPVLASYYMWYTTSTWSASQMSDLPTIKYNSSDDATIDRQLAWASQAGITGFISSWWGPGDTTDKNFARLLSRSATLEQQTGTRFTSTIYLESNAAGLNSTDKIVNALRYLMAHYGSDSHFFHWQGKPVIFIWDPLGQGRTLDQWAAIRQQADPGNQMLWSAEGVNTDLLRVFDGLHLFSAGYWGIKNNTMPAVDNGFRTKIDAYNNAHNTRKIWAAGVLPGYDDTRVPGRTGAYTVPRNNGATYTTSWQAAIGSRPDWITITSFNEWFEGSQIEPGTSYNMQYLNLTRQFARQWRR